MPDRDTEIERIAKEQLGIPTFAVKGRDRKDFYELGVWAVQKALRVAYEAGHRSGYDLAESQLTPKAKS